MAYLRELIALLGYLREPRFVTHFRKMMRKDHVIDRLLFNEADYRTVSEEGLINVIDNLTDTQSAEYQFVHYVFFDKRNEAKYAHLAPRCFIALCEINPTQYPKYLGRFSDLLQHYLQSRAYLDETLKEFGAVVDVETFILHFANLENTVLDTFIKLEPNGTRQLLTSYFNDISASSEIYYGTKVNLFIKYLQQIDVENESIYRAWLDDKANRPFEIIDSTIIMNLMKDVPRNVKVSIEALSNKTVAIALTSRITRKLSTRLRELQSDFYSPQNKVILPPEDYKKTPNVYADPRKKPHIQ